jgi:hypothetical protein
MRWPGDDAWQQNRGKSVATLTGVDRRTAAEWTRCRGKAFYRCACMGQSGAAWGCQLKA